MMPNWTGHQLALLARHDMRFSKAEAEAMKAAIRARRMLRGAESEVRDTADERLCSHFCRITLNPEVVRFQTAGTNLGVTHFCPGKMCGVNFRTACCKLL